MHECESPRAALVIIRPNPRSTVYSVVHTTQNTETSHANEPEKPGSGKEEVDGEEDEEPESKAAEMVNIDTSPSHSSSHNVQSTPLPQGPDEDVQMPDTLSASSRGQGTPKKSIKNQLEEHTIHFLRAGVIFQEVMWSKSKRTLAKIHEEERKQLLRAVDMVEVALTKCLEENPHDCPYYLCVYALLQGMLSVDHGFMYTICGVVCSRCR